MVGPLSSEEIEDVVSSVRRLVSNEHSPRRTTRDLGADRLLLTPALRVVSEVSPLAPLILDVPVPEPELAEPEIEAVEDVEVDETAVELIEADWEDEIWAAAEPVSLGEAALGAEEAEVLIPPMEEGSVEIGAASGELPEPWAQVGAEWVEDEPIPFVPLRRRAESLAARLASGEVLETLGGTDTVARVEAPAVPEAVGVESQPVDDLLTADLLAADSDDDIGAAEEDHHGPAENATTQRMPTEILDADGTPLAVLDEAALQEIVRQMIREELQGSLGERITRNVRKLVRAEINRALVARDLD